MARYPDSNHSKTILAIWIDQSFSKELLSQNWIDFYIAILDTDRGQLQPNLEWGYKQNSDSQDKIEKLIAKTNTFLSKK